MTTFLRPLLAAASLCAGLALPAQAALVLDLQTGGNGAACGGCGVNGTTFGWSFRVSSAIKINGLGMWDDASDGLGFGQQAAVQVGLWDNVGTLLASTSIINGSTTVASASSDGVWLFEDIADLTLGAGSYRIGALFFDLTPWARSLSGTTTIAEVTLTGGIQNAVGAGFGAPLQAFTQPIFGPTLRLADPGQVPEPMSLGLVAVALLGAAAARRQRG
jgi:hypothetical protein